MIACMPHLQDTDSIPREDLDNDEKYWLRINIDVHLPECWTGIRLLIGSRGHLLIYRLILKCVCSMGLNTILRKRNGRFKTGVCLCGKILSDGAG